MKRTFVSVLASALVVVGVAYSSSRISYGWHDSSQYSRVIVNATQGIETRPRAWFAQDKLVTDYAITNAEVAGWDLAVREYEATRHRLESYGLAVGTYISGTAVLPEAKETHWPWPAVPLEWMPTKSLYSGAWPGIPYRMLIDTSDPDTRRAFHEGMKRLWEQSPAPVRFVDNAAVHRSAGVGQPWSSYCANIEEIRKLGESEGSLQIFNIAVHVGEMSDEDTRLLIKAVGSGGILLEMPWHKKIRDDPAATKRAKNRYRQLLDSGMGIILAPPGAEPPQELVEWVSTWRKPTDHLYFGGAFYKAPDMKLFGSSDSR